MTAPPSAFPGERVSNFLQVPLAIEKIIGFGSLVCLDSFLYIFTILPIRSLLAFFALGSTYVSPLFGGGPRRCVPPLLKPLDWKLTARDVEPLVGSRRRKRST